MPKIESYSLFCEDVRWENNGSPMFIGVMSPLINAERYPVEFNAMNFVTMLRADTSVAEMTAELELHKITGSEREIVGSYQSTFHREEGDLAGDQWVAVSTLPLSRISLEEGQALLAELRVDGCESLVFLRAGSPLKDD